MRLSLIVAICIAFHFIPNDKFNVAFMFTFFAIGFYSKSALEKMSERFKKIASVLCVFAFIVLLCFWKVDYNVWNAGSYLLDNTGYTIFACLIRFAIGFFGIITMGILFNFISTAWVFKKFENLISEIGQHTLAIYILQSYIVEGFGDKAVIFMANIIGKNIFMINTSLMGYVIAPTLSMISILLVLWIIKLIKKIPYIGKFAFGCKLVDSKNRNRIEINRHR